MVFDGDTLDFRRTASRIYEGANSMRSRTMGIGEGLRSLEKLVERTTAVLLNFSAEFLANDFSFKDVRKGPSICSNERDGPDAVVQATFWTTRP